MPEDKDSSILQKINQTSAKELSREELEAIATYMPWFLGAVYTIMDSHNPTYRLLVNLLSGIELAKAPEFIQEAALLSKSAMGRMNDSIIKGINSRQ